MICSELGSDFFKTLHSCSSLNNVAWSYAEKQELGSRT